MCQLQDPTQFQQFSWPSNEVSSNDSYHKCNRHQNLLVPQSSTTGPIPWEIYVQNFDNSDSTKESFHNYKSRFERYIAKKSIESEK